MLNQSNCVRSISAETLMRISHPAVMQSLTLVYVCHGMEEYSVKIHHTMRPSVLDFGFPATAWLSGFPLLKEVIALLLCPENRYFVMLYDNFRDSLTTP